MADYLINHIWITIYGNKRVNNEINNIDTDKKDFNKYINFLNAKISLINDILESINNLMGGGIDVNTSNNIALEKLKHFKSQFKKMFNRFNLYIKEDTKNSTEPDIKIRPNQILKITPNHILKMTSNRILMILGHL